jgi:uncharacterized membrane protein
VQLPPIAADLALAWVVQSFLGFKGAAERTRLTAAALVALGPSFIAISGFHGQLDSVAVLPAALAVYAWEALPQHRNRALAAGVLVGVAIALKTAPGLVLLALLPTARGHRERLTLLATAAAVPLLAIAPWLLADPGGVFEAVRSHRAVPGAGGLSLLLQPELSGIWVGTQFTPISDVTNWFVDRQTAIVVVALIPAAILVYRRGIEAPRAATILWLTFYVFATAFSFQYAVWGLPFALMAGYVKEVAWIQAALLIPTFLVYNRPLDSGTEYVYVPLMVGIWLALIYALFRATATRSAPRIAA